MQRRHLRLAAEQPGSAVRADSSPFGAMPDRRRPRRWRVRPRPARATGRGRSRRPAGGGTRRPVRSASGACPARCERPHEQQHGRLAQRIGGHRRRPRGRAPCPPPRRRRPQRPARRSRRGAAARSPPPPLRSAATSVRSASTGPRHSACASRSRANALAGPRGPAVQQRPGLREVQLVGRQVEAVAVLPGRAAGPAAAPRWPRSRETCVCSACRAETGASDGHSASTSWSTVTVRPSANASSARTARRLGPRTSTSSPSTSSAQRAEQLHPQLGHVHLTSGCPARPPDASCRVSGGSRSKRGERRPPASSVTGRCRPRREGSEMDHDKLNEFLGRFTADFGATGSAGLAVIGNRLGLYPALARGPGHVAAVRRAHRLRRALPHRVAAQPGRRRLRQLRPGDRGVLPDRGAGVLPGRPGRAEPLGGVPDLAGLPAGRAADHRGVPHRRGPRLARAPRGRARRLRRLLPPRLRRRAGARTGSRRWTASHDEAHRGAPGSPTSAAGSARRRC